MRGEHDIQQAYGEQRLPTVEAEQDRGDLDGGQIDGGHDHAVEEEAEIDGAEAAHGAGGFSGVAHLVKLEVGEDA